MRILLTADPLLPVPPRGYGGIERIVDALVRRYQTLGHDVALLAHPDSTVAVHRRFAWPALAVRGAASTVRNALALRAAIRDFRPDVVHSFARLAYLVPVLRGGMRVVMSYQRHTGGRQIRWASRLGGEALRFTGCSEFICAQGRASGGKWTAIPKFVETERYDFVPAVPADAPLVFLGRLDDIKGPDVAIAIARAAGRRLLLAGNRTEQGSQRRFFDEKIAPWLGRDGIEWIGEVDDARKNSVLGTAAALVAPIQWDEPFGIVFVEALACGTPVLTCPRGAAPEVIREHVTGRLIQNVADGVAAVRSLAAIDRRACRRDAEERFDVAHAADAYLALYASIPAGRSR